MSIATDASEAAILNRIIHGGDPGMSADAADSLLALRFSESDEQRMNELAEKARQGTLLPDEERALDNYERVGHLIALLQSKARKALPRGCACQ